MISIIYKSGFTSIKAPLSDLSVNFGAQIKKPSIEGWANEVKQRHGNKNMSRNTSEPNIETQDQEGKSNRDFYRFRATNCDIATRLVFEDWATVPMIRIVKFLLISSEKVFNYRVIAMMVGVSIGTAYNSIRTLIENNYLIVRGNKFSLNLGHVQKTEHLGFNVQKTEQNVQKTEHDSNYIKERSKNIPTSESEPSVPHSLPAINNLQTSNEVASNGIKLETRTLPPKTPPPPSHLSLKAEPLIEKLPGVWLTESEQKKLAQKVGTLTELTYLLGELSSYSKNKPSQWRKNKDHYETLLNWRRMKLSAGKGWFDHPTSGPGYYPNYEIERVKRSMK